MKVLFFTHIYDDFAKTLILKGIKLPGIAVSNYESGFLKAFQQMDCDIETVNRCFYPYLEKNVFDNISNQLPKDQVFLLRHKYQNLYFAKSVKSNKSIITKIENADVVVFSTYHDWRLFKYVKKINPNIRSVLILPDLPNFLINKSSFKHRVVKRISSHFFYKNCRFIDAAISITSHMSSFINRFIKRSIVIEGVVKDEDIQTNNRSNYLNNIVYSGGLAKKYGILQLIDAFKETKRSDFNLVVCGKGECELKVIEEAKKHPNIIFKGFIPREEVLQLLSSSAYLVVPECPKNEYSKYSFHSKLIEYFGSGTPVIAYMYPGIPSDYKDYLLCVPGDGSDIKCELKESLLRAMAFSRNENISFGKKAQSFIVNRLSSQEISKKITKLIEDMYK